MPDAPSAAPAKQDPVADLMKPEVIDSLFPGHDGETAVVGKEQGDKATASEGKASETSSPAKESETAKADSATNPTSDSPEPAVDLSGIPGVLQAAINSLPAEKRSGAVKELREGYLRHKEWTQRTQVQSKDEKDAQAWRAAMARPKLVKAWQKSMSEDEEKPETSEPSGEDDEKVLEHLIAEGTPKEWAAYLKKRDESVRQTSKKDFEALYEEKAVAPQRRFRDSETALQAYADENGISYDDMRAAVKAAVSYPSNGPIETWDPAKAVDLVTPFLPKNGTPKNGVVATKSNGAAPQPTVVPKVAPPGRGSGAAAPSPLPAHRREGRLPKTNQEQAEELAHLLTEQLGQPISVADLDRINH